MNKAREFYYKFKFLAWLNSNKKLLDMPSGCPRCFVFLAADYGNLGDVAITYAQETLLKEYYPEYEIVDVPISKMLSLLRPIKKNITPNDIITITGGGNMGEMYGDIELLRLMIIRMFPKNKVIVFPQTTDYKGENTYLFRLAKKVYNNHRDLTILAREEVTHDKISEYFSSAKTRLVPDIVMTLDEWQRKDRTGILFCLRDDREKSESSHKAADIMKEAERLGISICHYDTHINKERMSLNVREEELKKIWGKFSASRLVVTDRLHGMIFAYITGTPAIVFPNSNFKVEKCYEWIADCGYIFFCKEKVIDIQLALSVTPDRVLFEQNNRQFIQKIKSTLTL